ncbi:MAG: hypothetical protein AB4368_17415, partial [Xenococcaceae cyanobacterium]
MRIPDFITHYHLADRQPFLSLSELKLDEQSYIFNDLLNRHKNEPGYHRRYGKDYIDKRKRIKDTPREILDKVGQSSSAIGLESRVFSSGGTNCPDFQYTNTNKQA